MDRFQILQLYPTSIIQCDWSTYFSSSDVEDMIQDVDKIIDQKILMQYDEQSPKHQSKPILFKEDRPEVCQKLKYTFLNSCKKYMNLVEDFTHNKDNLQFTGERAWFYKGWSSLDNTQSNPWHNHTPSFLSGVFYLSIPNNLTDFGTEFADPRYNEFRNIRTQSIKSFPLTWAIFPGWLNHKSVQCNLEIPRYVIAADSYVKVI